MLDTQREVSHKPRIIFFIDHKKFEAPSTHLSVREILTTYAKEDPEKVILAQKKGKELIRLTNLEEMVCIENGMHFVVIHKDPTTVS